MKLSFTDDRSSILRRRITPRYSPSAVRDEPEQLELGERGRDVGGAETGALRDLVGRRPARRRRRAPDGGRSAERRCERSTGRLDPERLEDVLGRSSPAIAPRRSSAFVPAERRRGDLARHGEHLAALLEREVGRDQRAAPLARLDDDRRARAGRRRSGSAPESATERARRPAGTRRRSSPRCAIPVARLACARG